MPVPVLAKMLFTAINEQESALARVSRLLHDDVSQVLSAVGLQLDAMRMDFRSAAPGIDQRATEIQGMLEQAIEQLREITNDLNPSIVERAGLHFALDRLADKFRKDFGGTLRVQFDPTARVPTSAAKAFYRIAECAVQNALARPGCSRIDVQVKKRSQGDFVLEVSDNGRSEETDSAELSIESMLMDYYASNDEVALTVRTDPDSGTVVRGSARIAEPFVK